MKKQSLITILLTVLMNMTGVKTFAHDIEAANADGKTIYYVWANEAKTELAVSYRGSSHHSYSDRYTGNVVIPKSVDYNGNTYPVTSIISYAFSYCSDLTSVTIPNSVTSIGYSAFLYCSSLTSITIPNSVTYIGSSAFYGSVWYDNQPDGMVYFGKVAYTYKGMMPNNTVIEIQDGTVSIADYAFSFCRGLTSVTIPNSVTSIGERAFNECSGLTSVIIGSGVLSISSSAFSNTNLKKTIWLTNTPPLGYNNASGAVNYVSNDQFGISNQVIYKYLSSYFVVDGIRYVPVSPSDRTCDAIDCTYDASIENINIGETVTNKGVTLTVMKVNPYTCYGNKYVKDIKLSWGGNIGDYAFCGCDNMETVELGQNITSIGDYSFSDCPKLKSIVIPDAVTSVGSYAFQNCSALTSAKIGNGVVTIKEYAFSGCSSLSAITIPQAVTTIGDFVLYNCASLAKVTIADSENTLTLGSNGNSPIFSSCPLDNVYIGRDISYQTSSRYGYSPFYRNTMLREVKITDKETEISENEFYGCTNLQTATIGDGVTTIGNRAYSGCSSLKYFTFGSNLENIGQEAFSDCTALVEICSKAATPPECGNQALDDINKWECKLYVPKGCIAAYQGADQWKEFFFTEEGEGTIDGLSNIYSGEMQIICNDGRIQFTGINIGTPAFIYNVNGHLVGSAIISSSTTTVSTSLRKGDIGIVKFGDKAVKVLMK